MKITMNRKDLQTALATCAFKTSKRALTCCAYVHVAVAEHGVVFNTSDGEDFITSTVGYVEDSCEVAPFITMTELLLNAVKSLKSLYVSLQFVDNTVYLCSELQGEVYRLQLQKVECNYMPKLPAYNPTFQVEIPASVFSEAYKSTSFAVATDDTRPVLACIYIHTLGKWFHMVATDTHRMSHYTCEIESGRLDVCMKDYKLKRAYAICAKSKGVVKMSMRGSQVNGINYMYIQVDNTMFTLAYVDFQFPSYARIEPRGNNHKTMGIEARFDCEAMKSALKRIQVVMKGNKYPAIKVMNGYGSELVLYALNEATGASLRLHCGSFKKGDDFDMVVNCNYLLEAVEALNTDMGILKASVPCRPFSIEGLDETSAVDSSLYIVQMPMAADAL